MSALAYVKFGDESTNLHTKRGPRLISCTARDQPLVLHEAISWVLIISALLAAAYAVLSAQLEVFEGVVGSECSSLYRHL